MKLPTDENWKSECKCECGKIVEYGVKDINVKAQRRFDKYGAYYKAYMYYVYCFGCGRAITLKSESLPLLIQKVAFDKYIDK